MAPRSGLAAMVRDAARASLRLLLTMRAVKIHSLSRRSNLLDVGEAVVARVDDLAIFAVLQRQSYPALDFFEDLRVTHRLLLDGRGDDDGTVGIRVREIAGIDVHIDPRLSRQADRNIEVGEIPMALVAPRPDEVAEHGKIDGDEFPQVANPPVADNPRTAAAFPAQRHVAPDRRPDPVTAGRDHRNAAGRDAAIHLEDELGAAF